MNERIVVYLLMETERFSAPLNLAEKRLIAFATAATAALTAVSMKLAATYESQVVGFQTLAQTSGDRFKGVMSNVYGQIQAVDKEMSKMGGPVTIERYTETAERVRGSLAGLTAEFRTTREESKAMGKQLLDDITQLAVATPYQTDELIAAARTLAGYGVEFENVLPTLNAIGEVVAGVGGDLVKLQRITLAYGQVISKNRFYAQELRQFTESGVGARDFADAMGVSVKEFLALMEAGQVGSDVVVKAFQRMTAEGGKFHGLMRDLMKTPAGRFNALRESVQIQMRELGRKAWEGLEVSGFWGEIGRVLNEMKTSGPAFGEAMKNAFTHVKSVFLSGELFVKSIADMASRAYQGAPNLTVEDIAVWVAKIPYEAERFGLNLTLAFTEADKWIKTKLMPGMEAMAFGFGHILGSVWNEFAVNMNTLIAHWNKHLNPTGRDLLPVAVWDVGTKAGLNAFREGRKALTEKTKVDFDRDIKGIEGRIKETHGKIKALKDEFWKGVARKDSNLGIGMTNIPELTMEQKLLGPQMADFVSKVKTGFRDGSDAAGGFANVLKDVTDKFRAMDKAADPIKWAWREVFEEMTKIAEAAKNVTPSDLLPKQPSPVHYNPSPLAGGLGGGLSLQAEWALRHSNEAATQMARANENWTRRLRLQEKEASMRPTSENAGAIRSAMGLGGLFGGAGFAKVHELQWVARDAPQAMGQVAEGLSQLKVEADRLQDSLDRTIPFFSLTKESLGGVMDVAAKFLGPLTLALSNSQFVDAEGTVGMKAIVEALAKKGLNIEQQAAAVQTMLRTGEIRMQGLLSAPEQAFGTGRLFDALQKRVGYDEYLKALQTMPRPMEKGSQEAQDVINRARYGPGLPDPEQAMRDVFDLLKKKEEREAARDAEILRIWQKLDKEGVTKLAVVSRPHN